MPRFILFGLLGAVLNLAISSRSAAQTQATFPTVQRISVASDGSGDFKTVQDAVNAAPNGGAARCIIALKPGIYREKLVIPREKGPLTLEGTDAAVTVLTFDDFAGRLDAQGKELGTSKSFSTSVSSDDFVAENITFENTHEIGGGVGNQALALSFQGDRGVFRRCRFLGKQDTLYLARNRQYFEDCFIAGQVDFIFGAATAWFERCELSLVARGIAITAASTPQESPFGYVFSHCKISAPAGAAWKTHLGRPWRPYASVIYLHTEMAEVIEAAGWNNWNKPDKPDNEKTARYAESGSSGPGANSASRVAWSKTLNEAQARAVTLDKVLGDWNPQTSLPLLSGPKTTP